MNNTILIVDDMRLNIMMLMEILGDDYTIISATSGEGAIKLIESEKPDLVLLDIVMPGIDGFDVLRFVKEHGELSSIPIIFVTGMTDKDTEEKGLALGAVDYISKPYNGAVVKARVKNHLELKTCRDNLEMLVTERTKQLSSSREAIIMGMSLMSETHDKVTGEHLTRIKYCTGVLARKMLELYPYLIDEALVNDTELYSPLHDVGKICISDTILKKSGILTPEEYSIMKLHTLDGGNLLRQTDAFLSEPKGSGSLNTAIEIAECHHERFDGTGYPRNLKGSEIPLPARIVSVADVYDALRSSRPYKTPLTHEEAINIIFIGDGRTSPAHFDPMVLYALSEIHYEFMKIY